MAKKFKREYLELNAQINKLKLILEAPLETKMRREIEKSAADDIISGATLIFTTLSLSSHKLMEKHFLCTDIHGYRPFSVCIMDEASQFSEPETLIPFKFGFSKLVMVGDQKQFQTTVFSSVAKLNYYQQSLFTRLVTFFSSEARQSPVLTLKTQYRMHPGIVDWPSKYFYGGNLLVEPLHQNSKLSPFTVFDTKST